jgi:hypothetical protein
MERKANLIIFARARSDLSSEQYLSICHCVMFREMPIPFSYFSQLTPIHKHPVVKALETAEGDKKKNGRQFSVGTRYLT